MRNVELEKYELGKVIGKGVMGTVYRGRQIHQHPDGSTTLDETEVAVKILNKEYGLDAAYRKLFKAEAERFKELEIPNIAEVIDIIFTDNVLGVVMPIYQGKLLSDFIPREGLPVVEVLNIMEPIGEAIDQMHAAGVIHGNLTPTNIILDSRGFIPILLDVGTHKNAFWMGCIQPSPYRSPEESRERRINPYSDRYAFALMVYKMLAGTLPWPKKAKEREILDLKLQDRLHPLSMYCPNVSMGLLSELMEMISAKPGDRPLRCRGLIDALREALFSEEETGGFSNIDPAVLQKAIAEVTVIDKKLAEVEKKIKEKENHIEEIEEKYAALINEERQKFSNLELQWAEQFSSMQTEINDLKQEVSGSFLETVLPTFTSAGRKKKERSKKLAEAKKLYKELKERAGVEVSQAKEKLDEVLEAEQKKFDDHDNKLRDALALLYKEKENLEFELYEYEHIHPRLLGFRAKKPFSQATLRVGKLTLEMILIPKGKFAMGAYPGLPNVTEAERPLHDVIISQSFWVSEATVTQFLYQSIIGKNPSHFKNGNNPVEMVSWHEAIQFCNTLSAREGLQPCYEVNSKDIENVRWNKNANGYRLLTEAEWEYVAKAKSSALYSGGNVLRRLAWFDENSDDMVHEIKQKDPNKWGMYDMSGNVWEWCWDWFGDYPDARVTDPMGPSEGKGRVFRGGSYAVTEDHMRVTYRAGERPHNKMDGIGFRLARNSR